MTKKSQFDFSRYLKNKKPRLLGTSMENALERGELQPLLGAVNQDSRLRLEIRDNQFNVYYRGGNLLRVKGKKSPWQMHFDEKYFKHGSPPPPSLPTQCQERKHADAWVSKFHELMDGMDRWWAKHPQGERDDCQKIASSNAVKDGLPSSDYLVLDLEYAYAYRRFDMVAAKRRPTIDDPMGWIEPDLVFVEVKSKLEACIGKSGLGSHARDYRSLVEAVNGTPIHYIKDEYKGLISQKKRLGLLHKGLPFRKFSDAPPELLVVFVGPSDLDQNNVRFIRALTEATNTCASLTTRMSCLHILRSSWLLK